MNIREQIEKALLQHGWTATRLAREAGIAPPVITRFLSGERSGLHSSTLEKLWPYICGDKRPTTEEAA
jgi:DNA-binding Xre family transcriptional regulator